MSGTEVAEPEVLLGKMQHIPEKVLKMSSSSLKDSASIPTLLTSTKPYWLLTPENLTYKGF